MSGAVTVLDGGLQTTIQDAGRSGLLAIGIPRSGALDGVSFRLANLIAGNSENTAALEIRSPGPMLRLESGTARIALAGTAAGLLVERGGVVQEWAPWRGVDLAAGDLVRVAPFADTAIAYLAFSGGVDVPESFGSRATFLRGGFGGLEGRALRAGDRLPLLRPVAPEVPCLTLLRPPDLSARPLRVVPGPQADHFPPEALAAFYGEPFRVSRNLDRMGARLEGPQLGTSHGAEIVSDATTAGAIQVPGSGQPILLLNDCQTTGGYPKIAVVISADMPAAGRLVTGSGLRFQQVSLADAKKARTAMARAYENLKATLVPVRDGAN